MRDAILSGSKCDRVDVGVDTEAWLCPPPFFPPGPPPFGRIQAEYWRAREATSSGGKCDWVDYGNDVEGSAFADPDSSDPLGSTRWNLKVGADSADFGPNPVEYPRCLC